MPRRTAFTLVELLVVLAIGGVMLAILLPAIQAAREAARCSSCADHLKQIGLSLQVYHDAHGTFPSGGCVGWSPNATTSNDLDGNGTGPGRGIFASAHTMLLPYLEETELAGLYNHRTKWWFQDPKVVGTAVHVYACPSAGGDNPFLDKLVRALFLAGGVDNNYGELGVTNYAVCKGVTDAYCLGTGNRPPGPPFVKENERGMFDFNWAVNARRVSDGLSKTIAVGEVTHGPAWPVSDAEPYVTIWTGMGVNRVYDNKRVSLPHPDSFGQQRLAWQAWCDAQPFFRTLNANIRVHMSNVMACTLEPMNKWPPTQAQYDDAGGAQN